MEESLYFEPETSGNKKRTGKKKKDHKILKLFFFLLFLLVIILIIIWLLKGTKTISGQYPENIKNEALNCESESLEYPKITSVTSDKKKLQINLIFKGENKLSSIALIYTLYLDSEDAVKRAEAFAHAEFNLGLNAVGYNTSSFDNKFARYSDRLIISVFGNSSEINEKSASYFMLRDVKSSNEIPQTIDEFVENYQNQGFTCNSSKQ